MEGATVHDTVKASRVVMGKVLFGTRMECPCTPHCGLLQRHELGDPEEVILLELKRV
jgi:hypothetical protein